MGVLMENLDHKIDLVVEGQQALAERLDRVEKAKLGLVSEGKLGWQ